MKREINYFHLVVESKLISCDVVLEESKLNKFLKGINKSIRNGCDNCAYGHSQKTFKGGYKKHKGCDRCGGIKVTINKVDKMKQKTVFITGDKVKIESSKRKLTLTSSVMSEGKRYWFVKERVCAILEDNLTKVK